MSPPAAFSSAGVCINDVLTDDELRAILSRFLLEEERDLFGLVCKRWLRLQSSERRRLRARAGPLMLRRMADRFPGIVELDLSQSASRSFYPGVTDADLAVVARGFLDLRVLLLQDCKGVTDVGVTTIGNGLRFLQALDVSGCKKLTDTGLVAVAKGCSNLRALNLSNCKTVTDNLLQMLSNHCPNLEELGLFGCYKVTNSGLSGLVRGCRHVKSLDVSKCNKIGDAGITVVSRVCSSSLRTLKLLDCSGVGNESVFTLTNFCKNLETLNIGGCPNVTNESIISLANSCSKSLQNLRLECCLEISDLSLACVLSACRNLVALDISCCERVTDSSFHALQQADFKSGLKVLKAKSCPRITLTTMALLLENCKSLEYLDVRSCPHISKLGCDQAGLHFPKSCRVNFSGSLAEADPFLDVFF